MKILSIFMYIHVNCKSHCTYKLPTIYQAFNEHAFIKNIDLSLTKNKTHTLKDRIVRKSLYV